MKNIWWAVGQRWFSLVLCNVGVMLSISTGSIAMAFVAGVLLGFWIGEEAHLPLVKEVEGFHERLGELAEGYRELSKSTMPSDKVLRFRPKRVK